jgi:signal peptidase I
LASFVAATAIIRRLVPFGASMTLPATPSARTRRTHVRWIFGVLALCAFFLALRRWVIEGFHIPTPSMEPTLLGDATGGDKVFVNKLAFLRAAPRRWQIVAFRRTFGGDGSTIVKRLVGLPGETLEIRDGDVYVDGARAPKPREVQDELLFPVFRSRMDRESLTAFWNVEADSPAGWEIAGDRLVVPAGERLRMSARAEVRDRYEHTDKPPTGGDNPDSDLAIRVRLRPLGPSGTITLALVKNADCAELRLELDAPSRAGTLRLNGKDLTPVGSRPIGARSAVSLLFWNVDGEIRVEVDGRAFYAAPYLPTPATPPPPRRNDARIEIDGAGAEIESLELSRDVYYTAEGDFLRQRAVRLLPDGDVPAYFFLGDNSPSSEDSRWWGPTLVAPADLIGAPFMVFWPPERMRLLR